MFIINFISASAALFLMAHKKRNNFPQKHSNAYLLCLACEFASAKLEHGVHKMIFYILCIHVLNVLT